MEHYLQKAKEAARVFSSLTSEQKNNALHTMAAHIRAQAPQILDANAKDLAAAKENSLSESMIERLMLNEKRIDAIAASIELIASLREPVGRILDGWMAPNGLRIEKVSVPIGVVAVIYESRPNVTADTAALCFKSSNVAVLKGGKEAQNSNEAIAKAIQAALRICGLPEAMVSLLPDSSREGVMRLVKMDKFVDLVIPRGGEALIRAVNENATVPVVKHDKGVCHIYLDSSCNFEKAVSIALNAKTQRPGVCNAMETLLVHESIAHLILPKLKEAFDRADTRLKGCEKTAKLIEVEAATNEDFDTEWLANILNIRVVSDIKEAIDHIARFGSQHSEAIVTDDYEASERFLNEVDASCVYVNASTRFTDGGEFGFGAEVGISTNKLHARGPMGINDLVTYKYKVYGQGQIRK